MPASYPTSAKAFTSKSDGAGNTILAAHMNDVQAEITAIETDLIAGLAAARGGTGRTTIAAGSVLVGNGTSAVALAAPSVSGYVLTDNGAGVAPSFQAVTVDNENSVILMQVFN